MVKNTNFPGFYRCFDLCTKLPGPATLKIKIWDDFGFHFRKVIGETEIDVEDRYF